VIELKELNWDEFNHRKLLEDGDERYFSFRDWEIDYLVREISLVHPEYNEIRILRALLKCCETIPAPYPKNEFYRCVINRLNENNS